MTEHMNRLLYRARDSSGSQQDPSTARSAVMTLTVLGAHPVSGTFSLDKVTGWGLEKITHRGVNNSGPWRGVGVRPGAEDRPGRTPQAG